LELGEKMNGTIDGEKIEKVLLPRRSYTKNRFSVRTARGHLPEKE